MCMCTSLFRIPAVHNSAECTYKKIYTVETTRFERCFIPRVSSCYTKTDSIVAVAVDKKLNLVILPVQKKAKPDVKKFSFEEPINSVSICEAENKYALLIVTGCNAFVINGSCSVVHIDIFPITAAVIFSYDNTVFFICGCDDGLIVKDSLSAKSSQKVQKLNNFCDSGVSQIQTSFSKELVACGFLNGTVSILKTSTLDCIWTKTFSYGSIRALSWNRNDNILAFAGQDDNFYSIGFPISEENCNNKKSEVNNNNNNKTNSKDNNGNGNVACFEGHNSFVNSVSFDPCFKGEEQRIFTTAEDAMIGVWTAISQNEQSIAPEKTCLVGPFEKPLRYIQAMKHFLVTVDTNGTIICWRKVKQLKCNK